MQYSIRSEKNCELQAACWSVVPYSLHYSNSTLRNNLATFYCSLFCNLVFTSTLGFVQACFLTINAGTLPAFFTLLLLRYVFPRLLVRPGSVAFALKILVLSPVRLSGNVFLAQDQASATYTEHMLCNNNNYVFITKSHGDK